MQEMKTKEKIYMIYNKLKKYFVEKIFMAYNQER